jgi:myo-inositol-1(or 4)-monophosphatase
MDNSICFNIYKIIISNLGSILQLRKNKILKSDNSYVTEGDLLCQQLVFDFLKSNYPDYLLISEESFIANNSKLSHGNIIILDPIDGTENFTSGLKEWGISISVFNDFLHKESLVGLPELNCILKTGDNILKFESRIIGLSSNLNKIDLQNLSNDNEYRIIGCAVYNFYNVITGAFHTYSNPKGAKVWDIMAGLNLALEHSLTVIVNNKIYEGEFLDPNKTYIFKVFNK